MASDQIRFLQPQQPQAPRRKRWRGCLTGLSCFGKQKGGKRVVPSSRIPDANLQNGPLAGPLPNQATGIALSLYAPPSSPASFSHSALPSTAPSPNCYLSSNSPERPSSNMYVTGPYANETQLVSPPVFSTFTTEPSTAPLTPPPELAHLTTPSSPDVPYARFLSSSSVRPQWDPSIPSEVPAYAMPGPSHSNGLQTTGPSKPRQDSNFFCPETFAQFYLDQSSLSHTGGRLSISKESDAYNSNATNGHQNWQSRTCKADAEELEAYRASFGFSADDIVSTTQYVEIVDVMEDSFSMTTPSSSSKKENIVSGVEKEVDTEKRQEEFTIPQLKEIRVGNSTELGHSGVPGTSSILQDHSEKGVGDVCGGSSKRVVSDGEDMKYYRKMEGGSRRYHHHHNQQQSSNSDAEIEYRRGRSTREGRKQRDI